MQGNEVDFLGRLHSLVQQFGVGGILFIFILMLALAFIAFLRGPGPIIAMLFLTYATGGISAGGIMIISTMARWVFLILLGISVFKGSRLPHSSMLLIYFYAFLGFAFVSVSPVPMWSFQQAVLLALVVLTVSMAVDNYIDSYEKVESIFKMGIFAAFVWTVSSMMFFDEFTRQQLHVRFTVEGVNAVVLAYSGAFFAPMLVWGVVQNKYIFWRIASALILVPFVFLMFLGAVRSAIGGMLMIGTFPLLFLRGKPIRTFVMLFIIAGILCISVFMVYMLLPSRAEILLGRLFETGTSGRYEVWIRGLQWVISDSMLIGRGIGAADTAKLNFGLALHNSYLNIWYNTGFIGLLAMLSFIGLYIMKAFGIFLKSPNRQVADVSRILLGYMLAIAAIGFFESTIAGAARISIVMLIMVAAATDRLKALIAEQESVVLNQDYSLESEYYDAMHLPNCDDINTYC